MRSPCPSDPVSLLLAILPLTLLGACGVGGPGQPPAGAAAPPPPEAPVSTLPPGAGDGWLRTVGSRIAAEARAIHPRDGAFAANLPTIGLSARFDDEGLRIDEAGVEVLSLRTVAWGREGLLDPVGAREPRLGACTSAVDAQGVCIRRLEYADEGLTEWWVGLGTGVEQGWSLDSTPAGEGRLVLEVVVDGALSVESSGEEATIIDAQARAWTVGGLNAWDARGRPLPVEVQADGDTLRLEVEDAGATYPIEIDPVYAPAAWTVSGASPTESFADSVAAAGDVNNDGYDDVIIGGEQYDLNTGRAYVYHGASGGLSTAVATTLTGVDFDNCFGSVVAGAGDVNNDGYDDVLVGAPGRVYTDEGGAYLFHGSSSGVSSSPATTFAGIEEGDRLGYAALSPAGDLNADGYDDVLVTAWKHDAGTGRVLLFYGSSTGISSSTSDSLSGVASDGFGWSTAAAGDMNRDGYDDVIIGALGVNSGVGQAYVFLGGSSGISAVPDTTLDGEVLGVGFGRAVSGAGDVNGDGYRDVLVASYGYGALEGWAAVYHGGPTGVSSTASTTFYEGIADEGLAVALSGAGDLNGDGFDEVIIGTAGYGEDGKSRALIYSGSATGASSTASVTYEAEGYEDGYGRAVSRAGDVDQDGFDDIIIGAWQYDAGTGRAYVYHGSPGGPAASATTTFTGTPVGANFGYAVSGAGDVDNDGYDDVLIGEYGYDFCMGRVYVYHGSLAGLSTTASVVLTGEVGPGYFGEGLGRAGDVNQDGYADVIISAGGYGTPTTWSSEHEGRVYVYYGSPGGLSAANNTALTGTDTHQYFGAAVSSACDVNGDGYDDVVVGTSPFYSHGGLAFVYHGAAGGILTTPAAQLDGTEYDDEFGESVSCAGDLNQDGYDDIVIGAGADGYYQGRIYVYYGSAAGVPTTGATPIYGPASETSYFGRALAGAGDVNGDGYDDLIVGGYLADSSTGQAYVFLGSSDGLPAHPDTRLNGPATHSEFGVSVANAGDVNHDGYGDVIVGAKGDERFGAAMVYHGTPSGVETTAATTLDAEGLYDSFGGSVAGAGDVDQDGFDDVLVGAPGYEGSAGRAYLFRGSADIETESIPDSGQLPDGVQPDSSRPDTAESPPPEEPSSATEGPSGKEAGCACSGAPSRSMKAGWAVGLLGLLSLRRRCRFGIRCQVRICDGTEAGTRH